MKLIKSLIYNRKLLKKIKCNLHAGKYILMPNLRTYCHINSKEKYHGFPQDGFRENSIKYKILSICFSLRIHKKHNSCVCGDVVYFTNCPDCKNRDIKVFDYYLSKVMIFCQNEVRYNLHERIITESRFFPSPKTLIKNKNKKIFVEELFERVSLLDNTNLFNSVQIMIEFYRQYYLNKNDMDMIDGIYYYTQHGDLSIDNIGINASQFVMFDFNFIGKYPLLYDLWFFAINYAFSYKSTCMIDLILGNELLKKAVQQELHMDFLDVSKYCFEFMKAKRLTKQLNILDLNVYSELFDYSIKKMENTK